MGLRPIWWWFWLGWFPLFWLFPAYLDAPIRHKQKDGSYTVSYQTGFAGTAAFVIFLVFLFLFLFASVDSVWYLLFYWIWFIALIVVIIIWIVGLFMYYFEDEHKQDKKPVEEVQVSVPEESKEEDNSNFKPMRMRSSRQMKSLNMQL
jgi:uncharacterized integral membrane protein